jgi:hypothetical protein
MKSGRMQCLCTQAVAIGLKVLGAIETPNPSAGAM